MVAIAMDFDLKTVSEVGIWLKENGFSDKIVDIFNGKLLFCCR